MDKSRQDNINTERDKILKELENFIQIPYKHCDKLILGTKIKYITDEGNFRIGGILIKNSFPEYIVLMNSSNRFKWSVNLKSNHIFIEDLNKIDKEKTEKNNLYKLYKNGLLSLNNDNTNDHTNDDSDEYE